MSRTQYIYVLREPTTNQVRYVGRTSKPEQREEEHATAIGVPYNKGLTAWERGLRAAGLRPVFEIIIVVQTFHGSIYNIAARQIEEFWIAHFRYSYALFNGWPGGHVKMPPRRLRKTQDTMPFGVPLSHSEVDGVILADFRQTTQGPGIESET